MQTGTFRSAHCLWSFVYLVSKGLNWFKPFKSVGCCKNVARSVDPQIGQESLSRDKESNENNRKIRVSTQRWHRGLLAKPVVLDSEK